MKVNTQAIADMYRIPGRELHPDRMTVLTGLLTLMLLVLPGKASEVWSAESIRLHSEAANALNRELTMGGFAFLILFFLLGRKKGRTLFTLAPAMIFLWKFWIPMELMGEYSAPSGILCMGLWSFFYLLCSFGVNRRFWAAYGSVLLCLGITGMFWLLFGNQYGMLFGGILIGASGGILYTVERILAVIERNMRWQPGMTWKEAAMAGMAAGRMNMGMTGMIFLSGCIGVSLAFYSVYRIQGGEVSEAMDMELAFGLLESLMTGISLVLIIPCTAAVGGAVLTGTNPGKRVSKEKQILQRREEK